MRHRLTSEREITGVLTDPFNAPVKTWTPILTGQPCYWQARNETLEVDGEKIVSIGRHRLLVPIGTDLASDDVITAVRDRRGRSLLAKRMRVTGQPLQRETHIQAVLEVYD